MEWQGTIRATGVLRYRLQFFAPFESYLDIKHLYIEVN